MPTLSFWGWAEPFKSAFEELQDNSLEPARVTVVERGAYGLLLESGHLSGQLTGRLRKRLRHTVQGPVVGDWVAVRKLSDDTGQIQHLLPRRSFIARRETDGTGLPQPLVANVDTVLIAMALNQDFNLRRLERYLALVLHSGAQPVVVLTKADLAANDEGPQQATAVARGAPVILLSSVTGRGIDALTSYLLPGQTLALLGSSGVGKSTLLNRLLGAECVSTRAIREHDGRGRHATTTRQLFELPSGALVIDTPGLREVGLWDADAGLGAAFEDVEALALGCQFNNCSHGQEPGCAVSAAIAGGQLDSARYQNYRKLRAELDASQERWQGRSRHEERKRMKHITQEHKRVQRQSHKR